MQENSPLSKQPIYFDNAAATPMDKRVVEAMLESGFGNAHARHHAYGARSHSIIEQSRWLVAEKIEASPAAVYFTSGALENSLCTKKWPRQQI